VFEDASGKLGSRCLYNRCRVHDWRSCRERLEMMDRQPEATLRTYAEECGIPLGELGLEGEE
jgi:hypothetical protein